MPFTTKPERLSPTQEAEGFPQGPQPNGAFSASMMPTAPASADPAVVVTATIVIVDDDPMLRRTVATNLEDAGYQVIPCDGGRAALEYFANGGRAAAILLDWHMPEIDGPEVLRRLRDGGTFVPVIFLTGHNQPIYEEAALAGGAVDFVDKSKSFGIILQRLRLAIEGAKAPTSVSTGASAVGLDFDDQSSRAAWRGKQVDLTLTEYRVTRLLAARAGRDVSYREIYDLVRGEGFRAGSGEEGYRANVRALIKRIRQKFRDTDPEFDLIENYPGFGYRWKDGAGA